MIVSISESINVFATELMKDGEVTQVEYEGDFTGEFYGKETVQRDGGKDMGCIRHGGQHILSGSSLDEVSAFYKVHNRAPHSTDELSDAIYTALMTIDDNLSDPDSDLIILFSADVRFSSDINLSSVTYASHWDGDSRINRPLSKQEMGEVLSGLEKRLAPLYK